MITSPWISEIDRKRELRRLDKNHESKVAIVGGGVAGMTTAYFLLTSTQHQVALYEATKIAHGATGHNGGYLATYFERPFYRLVEQFGLDMAENAREEVENAWNLLDDIFAKTKLDVPLWKVAGYAGVKGLPELLVRLRNRALRVKKNVYTPKALVASTANYIEKIPKDLLQYCSFVSHEKVLEKLECKNPEYTVALPSKKGCMNSALFTEKLCEYLLENYADRFSVFEESKVNKIELKSSGAVLHFDHYQSFAEQVVLCTNGFEHFAIQNTVGPDIDTAFHHAVQGSVGYMSAFLEKPGHAPAAVSFLPENDTADDVYNSEAYFYLSRRPFEKDESKHSLICVGGPESLYPDTTVYDREMHEYMLGAEDQFTAFLQKNYRYAPDLPMHYHYKWHGLMGYTPSGVRMVGFEPIHKSLMYNLGCNGLGLLPSISGGFRIARLLAGENLPPSIFDPLDSRKVPV